MNRRVILIFLILGWLMLSCRTLLPTPADVDLESEEYTVYSVVIAGLIGQPNQLVLHEHTSLNNLAEDAEGFVDYITENAPQIDNDLIHQFIDINKDEIQLKDNFNLEAEIEFINIEEYHQIFSEDGWDAFYSRFPESNGIITLSRIAFDRDYQHALVYVGHSFDFLGGAGQYVYMSKLEGSWVVEETILAWIS